MLGLGGTALLGGADAQAPNDLLIEVANRKRCHANPHASRAGIDSILLLSVPCIGSRHSCPTEVAQGKSGHCAKREPYDRLAFIPDALTVDSDVIPLWRHL